MERATALEGEAIGDPLVVARLQDWLGQTYLGLGKAALAEALIAKAVATRQTHLGADNPLTLASRHNQALAYEAAGKRIEAIKRFEQVRDARVKVLGADHPDTLSTLTELATAFHRAGKPTEAIPLLEQVRYARVKKHGEDHDHTLATLQVLARAYSLAEKHPEAFALAEKVRDARVKKHGDGRPHSIDAPESRTRCSSTIFPISRHAATTGWSAANSSHALLSVACVGNVTRSPSTAVGPGSNWSTNVLNALWLSPARPSLRNVSVTRFRQESSCRRTPDDRLASEYFPVGEDIV